MYKHVTQEEALNDPEGVIIDVRWVIVNKGTKEKPQVRCRLVGREFAEKGNRDDLFAGTPPLVTIRLLLSILAKRYCYESDVAAMVIDVKGAFLYGKTKRKVYIWLPEEDPKSAEGYMGKLEKAMYGTRDAPQVWQEEVRKTMEDLGFEECVTQPGIYHHKEKRVQVVSHVDDFLCIGRVGELEWFRDNLKRRYEIKSQILNAGSPTVSFLGRRITWTDQGLEVEADPKHVDILLKEWKMEECKACDTPTGNDEVGGGAPMTANEATLFRRAAARVNYLGQDRPDLNVASRLLAMRMAQPKKGDEGILKRVLRYLKGHPRSVYKYEWNAGEGELELYTDSDWAGDREERKSASGGVIMHGGHLIGHWSKLQNSPAPSSGEAELNAGSKGLSEMLGVRHLLVQLGMIVRMKHYLDASAAKGTMMRRGAGKIKHLEVRQLWCQHAVSKYDIEIVKIPRAQNLADNLTHPVGRRNLELFLEAIGVDIRGEP